MVTMLWHSDRHVNEIAFVKCKNKMSFSNWKYQTFREFLQAYKMRLTAPTLSATYEENGNIFPWFCLEDCHEFGDAGHRPVKIKDLKKYLNCQAYHFKYKREWAGKVTFSLCRQRRQGKPNPKPKKQSTHLSHRCKKFNFFFTHFLGISKIIWKFRSLHKAILRCSNTLQIHLLLWSTEGSHRYVAKFSFSLF